MSEIDRTAMKKIKISDEKSDYAFWSTQPFEARITALEVIRTEYNKWKYHDQQRFQRVYRILKLENFKKNKKAVGRHQDLADL